MEKWETGNGNIRYNKVAMNLAMNINAINNIFYTQNRNHNGITFSNQVTSKMDRKFSHYSTSLCSVV